jgi:hypothetical protein
MVALGQRGDRAALYSEPLLKFGFCPVYSWAYCVPLWTLIVLRK